MMSTYIELNLMLYKAITQWIEHIGSGLTGKQKAAAERKKKKWCLSTTDWDLLIAVQKVLKVR